MSDTKTRRTNSVLERFGRTHNENCRQRLKGRVSGTSMDERRRKKEEPHVEKGGYGS